MDNFKAVKVTYDSAHNRISVKGEGLKIVLIITPSELGSVYFGNEGTGKILVSEK